MTIQTNPDSLESVIDEIEDQLKINADSLGSEAIRQTKIFSVFQRLHMKHTRQLEKYMIQQNQVKMMRIRYYTGKLPAEHYKAEPLRESILKSDLDSYLKIDKQMLEMSALVNEQERIVKAIEEAKESLKSRGFNIKNAIDFQRMITLGV